MKKSFLNLSALLFSPAKILPALLLAASLLLAVSCAKEPVLECGNGIKLRVLPVSENIIRVSATPENVFSERSSLVVLPQKEKVKYTCRFSSDGMEVSTKAVTIKADREDGKLKFFRPDGSEALSESARSFKPVRVEGKSGYSISQTWDSPDDEAFYGLGQHQTFEYNLKGTNEELYQYNTKISVPFIVSTRGYGILWDSYSYSRFGNPDGYRQLGQVFTLQDKYGNYGSLTGTYIAADGQRLERQEDSLFFEDERAIKNLPDIKLKDAKVIYEGTIQAPADGDYYFSLYYAGFQSVWVGGEKIADNLWRPAWNPNSYRFRLPLKRAEKTPIRVEWLPDGDVSYMGLRVAVPRSDEEQKKLCFWSEMNPMEDYYFMIGDSYDEVISAYRTLSGKAPVIPRWALGFWQSRERYKTQKEIVFTFKEFRDRKIPIDNIVQDWQYWEPSEWGSHKFDSTRFPDPGKMLDSIHAMNGRYMISVWPKFYTNTANYKALKDAGYMYLRAEEDGLTDWLGYPESFYDAYAQGGRELFWKQIDENLYSRYGHKIDAWWMDASEPNLRDCLPMDYQKALTTPTALGPSTEYLNAYALMNAQAIYEGQRALEPDRRVFQLTRNGFAGLQRYSAASWSGDIGTSWFDMHAQMAAGLGYSMAGLPFWGMDIGGFSVMSKFYSDSNLAEWQELQTRWYQFGTFVPLFRAHGQLPPRELWNIAPEGSDTYEAILSCIKFRYRLMPYLYSMAGAVHFKDYTMLRGLVMDFPQDLKVRGISDQWMFGPAFMPCPIYKYKARAREVYLPESSGWYDYYSGEFFNGGRTVTADAPYERIPLFVRAGSIIPFGPELQWSDEKPADTIELHIYPGADACFTLYEDENLNYNYEKGIYSTIDFSWDDDSATLVIGERNGFFPGMLQSRSFVVKVQGREPVTIHYDGSPQKLSL